MLPLSTKLNIECNCRANQWLPFLESYSIFTPNPAIQEAFPHLSIHGKIVIQEMAEVIRHATTMPEYMMHIQQKYKWTKEDCYKVNWNAIRLTMQHFKAQEWQILQKLLHDWLPLWASPRRDNVMLEQMLCWSCQWESQDYWHFLECNQENQEQQFEQLLEVIRTAHINNNIDGKLSKLFWTGLQAIHQNQAMMVSSKFSDKLQEYMTNKTGSDGTNSFMDGLQSPGHTILTTRARAAPMEPHFIWRSSV